MKTLSELHVAFNNAERNEAGEIVEVEGVVQPVNAGLRYFAINMPEGENPYVDLSNYATADSQVANLGDGFYAATMGEFIDDTIAVEITA